MRGVWVEDWTEFENLAVQDCPEPTLLPNQVRVETQAAGVSFAQSLVVAGRYQRKPPRPFSPGSEIAGIVREVGAETRRIKVGDRVWAERGTQHSRCCQWPALCEPPLNIVARVDKL